MLSLTPAATAAIVSLLDSPDAPDHAALRVAIGQAADGEAAIGMSMVSDPDPGDEVIHAGAADIYVEPQAAEVLEDQLLDAEIEDDRVTFLLRPQPHNGGPPVVPPGA